jgi:hypothetical protein
MSILFCNVGWMERYQGLNSGDHIKGGGDYVKKSERGHEVCNFSPDNTTLYGYVQVPGEAINLDCLGAGSDDTSIGGVTVVWTATRPGGGTTIVGWYKDATIFRSYQIFKKIPLAQSQNSIDGFWMKAPAAMATILPVDSRIFEIPRQKKGGMGRSNIWYADRPESAKLVDSVRVLISGGQPPSVKPSNHSTRQDQERKARIEREAIGVCCAHFEGLGYTVESVEKDNLGWDLVARAGRSSLRIEVKGLSGSSFSIELTPNEYTAFSQCAGDYRLAVVVEALGHPKLFICRYSEEESGWLAESDEVFSIDIKIKESAAIQCKY